MNASKIINAYKPVVLFFIFFIFSYHLFGQKRAIDSLKIELQNHPKNDSIRVELLIDIAIKYIKTDYENAIKYLDTSATLSKTINYKLGIARSIYFTGYTTMINSNFNKGDDYLKEAIVLFQDITDTEKTVLCYSNLGVFYSRKRDYKSAILYYKKSLALKNEIGNKNIIDDLFNIGRGYAKTGNFNKGIAYYKKALEASKKTDNTKKIADCLSSIGNVYSHQGNYPLALEYLNQSLDIAKKNENSKNISDALLSIGNVHIRLQNYDKAITFYENALKETKNKNLATIAHNLGESYKYKKEYPKSLAYFEDALKKYETYNNKPDEAITLNKIGEIYLLQQKNYTAFEYFEIAKKINIEVDNPRGLSGSYLGIAKVYFNQKKYSFALKNALDCNLIASKLELIDIQRDAQQLLSEIYQKIGEYQNALSSHEKFKILNDSLFNKENIEKITQLEYEYKYKQQLDSASIRELKLTKTVKDTSQILEKSQRNYLWAIISILLVSMLLGGMIFYLKYRNIKSKTDKIVIEQKLLRSQMTPHFIFNSLSVLQGMILNKEDKKSISYLSKFSKLLRIILENSRDKMVLLSQELAAVENYLALQNLEDASYVFNISVEKNIDKESFKIPPMLIQPFVENSIEHAFGNQTENRQIDVHLKYENKQLMCTITDNGIGIDSKNTPKRKDKTSLATTITSERLEMLSKDLKVAGSVSIQDRNVYNEKGTLVTLVIPYVITSEFQKDLKTA